MSEPQVDLSAIRGDWRFHMNYLSHAITMTLAREMKYWGELGGKSPQKALADAVRSQSETWKKISSALDAKGSIRVESPLVDEFIKACRDTRALCDAWLDKPEGSPVAILKEFAEACRQVRALCDDVPMMREQKPDNA